jgi:hypothetical protein
MKDNKPKDRPEHPLPPKPDGPDAEPQDGETDPGVPENPGKKPPQNPPGP